MFVGTIEGGIQSKNNLSINRKVNLLQLRKLLNTQKQQQKNYKNK